MTLTALLALIALALIALPAAAFAANDVERHSHGRLGDIFPDERLVRAISGAGRPASPSRNCGPDPRQRCDARAAAACAVSARLTH